MELQSTTSRSSKRTRAPSGNVSQVTSCLVDGCNADLSKCRDYHRRHKVCEVHSKSPKVTIKGRLQRFCQQCSRFHSLSEFDEGKRSCRKRLEGHNRRRRKAQPEFLPVNPEAFVPAGQGSRFLTFDSSAMLPSSSVVSSAWSGSTKPEANPSIYGCRPSSSTPYPHPYGGRQFPFLQGPISVYPASSSSAHQSLHDSGSMTITTGSSSSSSSNVNLNHKNVNNELTQVITDYERALSLLSSSPAAAPATSAHNDDDIHKFGFNQVMHLPNQHPNTAARALVSHAHNGSMGSYPGLHALDDNAGHWPGVFEASSHERSSARGPHQTLSFPWGR